MKRHVRSIALAVALASLVTLVFAQTIQRRKGFAVRITEPADQAIVLGKTRIAAEVTAEDPGLVERVEFLVGDDVIFVDREAPYECFHDFGETARSWVVRATAHHKEGVSVSHGIVTRRAPFMAIERVNRVVLWVTATDAEGKLLTDLRREDFRVTEDGRPREILEFTREDRPITLALLLDTSGSMRDKMRELHRAAGSFVDTLRPEDRALVMIFDEAVFLVQDLTADHALLKEAITSATALGATALYDAVHAAYRKIGTLEGRRAMILLSDGEDTASQSGFARVLEEARSNSTVLYGIALGERDQDVVEQFAGATGGRYFAVNKAEELTGVYQRIAEELRAQYFITYSTDNQTWDGRFIGVKVEHADPKVKVRARSGYFAVRDAGPGS